MQVHPRERERESRNDLAPLAIHNYHQPSSQLSTMDASIRTSSREPITNSNTNAITYRKRHSSLSSHSPSFLLHNGYGNPCEISDIEMIALQSVTYTSLKDLLPMSPPRAASSTYNSSWNEIPIRNPLVKHAALAYLQPMASPPAVNRGFFGKLKDCCCCECGCFSWLCETVFRALRETFGDGRELLVDHCEGDDEL